jgi:galactose oxidase-like protein/Big-like domain-containing protein/Kelch motif protein
VTVTYTAAQAAGNLNVVVVGWGDSTSQISSVSDANGNTYRLAVGPTVATGSSAFSQAIYYATNMKAGTNVITVKFTAAAAYPDIRILEYSGINVANPVDVTAAYSSGNDFSSTLPSFTGTVVSTYAPDLLVGANTVAGLTSGPGANFTQRLLTYPDGNIVEDRVVTVPGFYSAGTGPVNSSSAWVMQMVAFRGATSQPPDSTPPTVSITPPAGGTGTITVTVNASDAGTGVAAVQLQVDGIPFGTAATTSPYTFSLNTAKFANGAHTLTASARDSANNTATSSPISVTFSNSSPGNPTLSGVWSGLAPLPIVSVNSVLLPNSKVLMWDGETFGATALVWDPATNTTDWVPAPADIFCSGTEQMADGRIVVVGGAVADHVGLPAANAFDWRTESWTVLANMAYPRWYPTATILQDGRLIVTSGETNGVGSDALTEDIYSPSTNSWSQLSSAPFPYSRYYPHEFLLPDGRILAAATTEGAIVSQVLDLNTPAWTAVGGTTALDGGSSAMYLPNKILKMGHFANPDLGTAPSTATAYVLDMTQTSPTWRQVSSMSFARTYHNSTLLPDGNVLVTGGGTTSAPADLGHAVLPAELWSPTTETWTTLASMNSPREYHSEALLLPDGRVLISGGGRFNDDNEPTYQYSAEFFSPPYLFKGARPVISSAPSQLSYGQNFTVQTPDAARIAKVSLIRFGSVTHDINMSQRFLPLSFVVGTGSLSITAPVNSNLAPPGNYMLFLVDTNGVPSVAAVVHF